jgi:tol-pal system protein YbgF
MIQFRYLYWLAGAACLLPGVVGAVDPDLPPVDMPKLMMDTRHQVHALGERVAKIEALLHNQAALNLLKEVEGLKAEVARLRGQAEMQTHQMDTLGKRQSDLYVDLDKRVEDLGKQVKPLVSPPAVASIEPPSGPSKPVVWANPVVGVLNTAPTKTETAKPPPVKPSALLEDPLAESRSYEVALNLFKTGNYAGAITNFKAFIKAFPDSTLAANAQYWTGYSYYALKDYKSALEQQIKLVNTWPQSPKVPDALLNIASNQVELDDLGAAKKNLEVLIARFPGSNAAAIAAKRLALLQ